MIINSSTPINELVNTILANSRNDRDGANSTRNFYASYAEVRKRSEKAAKYDKLVKALYERLVVKGQWINTDNSRQLGDVVEIYNSDGMVSSIGGQITPENLVKFLIGE